MDENPCKKKTIPFNILSKLQNLISPFLNFFYAIRLGLTTTALHISAPLYRFYNKLTLIQTYVKIFIYIGKRKPLGYVLIKILSYSLIKHIRKPTLPNLI